MIVSAFFATIQQQNANADLKEFKLYIKSGNEIELYSDIDNNYCLKTRFNKKNWGTWNIWGWFKGQKVNNRILIPVENGISMAGSGTDWEYVLRVSGRGKSKLFFGGDHGNEELINISIISYPDKKNIELIPGQIIDIEELIVIEISYLNIKEQGIENYADVR